jgi:hypothetical protein
MPNSAQVRCSCGQILKQPVPRICPGCKATISVVRKRTAGLGLSIVLVSLMFGILLGLILFLGNRFNS